MGEASPVHEDISVASNEKNPNVGPYQPDNIVFPQNYHKRHFQASWFNTYPWNSYSTLEDSASCLYCANHATPNNQFSFKDWQHTNLLARHSQSKSHQDAMAKGLAAKSMELRQTTVVSEVRYQHQKEVEENRRYLHLIVETTIFLAQQNIALRHVKRKSCHCPG
jgi:hypothetical protein